MYQRPWSQPKRLKNHVTPRVLVEESAAVTEVTDYSLFRQAGFDVAVCTGPDESTPCPLADGKRCPLARDADVVLFGLDLDDPAARRVLQAHRHRHPKTPVVIEAPDLRHVDVVSTIPNRIILRTPTSVAGQIRALWRAVFD